MFDESWKRVFWINVHVFILFLVICAQNNEGSKFEPSWIANQERGLMYVDLIPSKRNYKDVFFWCCWDFIDILVAPLNETLKHLFKDKIDIYWTKRFTLSQETPFYARPDGHFVTTLPGGEVGEWKSINRIPNETILTTKGDLSLLLRNRSYYPSTYLLYEEEDRDSFLKTVKGQGGCFEERLCSEEIWILKPTWWRHGHGIRLLNKSGVAQLVSVLQTQARGDHTWGIDIDGVKPLERDDYIIQRYIPNPLLVNGKKVSQRVYLLIASVSPLRALYYSEGYVTSSTLKYNLSDLSTMPMHLTNLPQQLLQCSEDELEPEFSLADFASTYVSPSLSDGEDFLEGVFFPQVEKILRDVVLEFGRRLSNKGGMEDEEDGQVNYFGWYSVDFLTDSNLKVWLNEVGSTPGFRLFPSFQKRMIVEMMRETLKIVLQIQRDVKTHTKTTKLHARRKYRWIVDEGL